MLKLRFKVTSLYKQEETHDYANYLQEEEPSSQASYDTEEDEYQDPYENLTYEELKEKQPPYLFMEEDEKEEYFIKLSTDYIKGINNAKPFSYSKKRKGNNKVKFDQKNNLTMHFNKFEKISSVNRITNKKNITKGG